MAGHYGVGYLDWSFGLALVRRDLDNRAVENSQAGCIGGVHPECPLAVLLAPLRVADYIVGGGGSAFAGREHEVEVIIALCGFLSWQGLELIDEIVDEEVNLGVGDAIPGLGVVADRDNEP